MESTQHAKQSAVRISSNNPNHDSKAEGLICIEKNVSFGAAADKVTHHISAIFSESRYVTRSMRSIAYEIENRIN